MEAEDMASKPHISQNTSKVILWFDTTEHCGVLCVHFTPFFFLLLFLFTKEEKKVGQRASASSHRYQKLCCVLTPQWNEHYPETAGSASHSRQIVGLPA